MVIRKAIPGEGGICDALLTRLIRLERQWEPNLDETFVVSDNYEVRMAEDGTLLLQNYFELDGAPTVSYEWFVKAD